MIRSPLDDGSPDAQNPWRGGRTTPAEMDAGATPTAPAAPTTPETPPEAGGSSTPPPDAGDETPASHSFPVPPVPPPPAPGPTFTLAGGGGGGAASFARPGTAAAKPFRSPIFTANRSTSPQTRFGAGAPVSGGAGTAFLPAGLGGDVAGGDQAGQGADELARIMALLRGGNTGVAG